MADQQNYSNEEEYQFSEEQSADVFGQLPGEATSQPQSPLVKNIILAIAIIAAGGAIYKISGMFTASKPSQQSATDKTQTRSPREQVEQARQQALDSQQASIKKQAEQAKLNQIGVQTNQLSQRLSDTVNRLQNQITNNKAEYQGIQGGVNEIRQSLRDLSNQMAQLTSKFTALEKDVTQLKERRKPAVLPASKRVKKRQRSAVKSSQPRVTYYLQAAIPGRAWIIATNGSILTVKEGESLIGYGKVTRIDAKNGMLYTSTGRVIRFHPKER